MRCIDWRTGSAAVLLALAACSDAAGAESSPAAHVTLIDDATVGKALLGRFDYVGHWQHVRGKRDGRSNGTSTRSTHTGDVAILGFNGTRIRLYGIRGPSGGRAGVALDDASIAGGRPIDFYATHTQTHVLLYQSPKLASGIHSITIVVWGTRDRRGRFYYVNLDGAEVED